MHQKSAFAVAVDMRSGNFEIVNGFGAGARGDVAEKSPIRSVCRTMKLSGDVSAA